MNKHSKSVKAIGLLSGGLDSVLAVHLIKKQGVSVEGIIFIMPWEEAPNPQKVKFIKQTGIHLNCLRLGDDYLNLIKSPKYGYGSAFNPCIDCHAYMIEKAGVYMKEINADFVFTGEVLGQRPMSQVRASLNAVAKTSGLKGRLLRPLSAKLLEPTIPEIEGLIDREKLGEISGRSRKDQILLATEFGIKNYPNSGGGCLLTDKNFGLRMKDFLSHDYRDYTDAFVLKWGRHFRINKDSKIILGRNKEENELLEKLANKEDYVLKFDDQMGPTAIVVCDECNDELFAKAGGVMQNFSKYRQASPKRIDYYRKNTPHDIKNVSAQFQPEDDIKLIQI